MSQLDARATAPRPHWQRRYRFRLFLGLALLTCAAAATVWVIAGVTVGDLTGSSGSGAGLADLADYARLGVRSIVIVALCAGVVVCATRPIRRGRADYAKLALAEVMLAGLLLAIVVAAYWLFWSPMSFLK